MVQYPYAGDRAYARDENLEFGERHKVGYFGGFLVPSRPHFWLCATW